MLVLQAAADRRQLASMELAAYVEHLRTSTSGCTSIYIACGEHDARPLLLCRAQNSATKQARSPAGSCHLAAGGNPAQRPVTGLETVAGTPQEPRMRYIP